MADEIADKLAALRPNYLRRLAARRTELAAAAAVLAGRDFTGDERQDAHRLVHSMGSSAAIYGYGDLSAAARAAERMFDDIASGRENRLTALLRVVEEARLVLETGHRNQKSSGT